MKYKSSEYGLNLRCSTQPSAQSASFTVPTKLVRCLLKTSRRKLSRIGRNRILYVDLIYKLYLYVRKQL